MKQAGFWSPAAFTDSMLSRVRYVWNGGTVVSPKFMKGEMGVS
jgi:hypothetical protein